MPSLRRGFRLNLFYVIILKVLFLYNVLPGIVVHGLHIDCEEIRNCHCYKLDNYEIQCPDQPLEEFPISLKVTPLNNLGAKLMITCDLNEPQFQWSLVQGLNLSKSHFKFDIIQIEILFCPIDESGLKDFYTQIGLDLSKITSFSFVTYGKRQISQFPQNFFNLYKNLEHLNLKSNGLSKMPNISPLTHLKTLNLHDNRITSLKSSDFSQNLQLINIQISSNSIVQIGPRTFPSDVQYLTLASNNLTTVTKVQFENLHNISYLFLQRNPLKGLQPDTFVGLKSLQNLDLSSSQFELLPRLDDLQKLENLSITYNPILGVAISENLKAKFDQNFEISHLNSLFELKLTNISLKSLPVFENLPNLRKIDLKGNLLESIEKFDGLQNITFMDLSKNLLVDLGEITLPLLVELDLSRNKLKELNRILLRNLGKIVKLSIAHNLIETVDSKAFENLSNLEDLDLSYNKINFEDSPQTYYQSPLKNSLRLKKINLESNRIETIHQDWNILFNQLEFLNLRKNKLKILGANDLNFLSWNLKLDLRENELSIIDMSNYDILLGFLDDPSGADEKRMTVLLDGNPLYCDCQLLKFKQFNLKAIDFQTNHLYCSNGSNPDVVRRKFNDISDLELICPIGEDQGCPGGCTCSNRPADKKILVNCQGLSDKDNLISSFSEIKPKSSHILLDLRGSGISHLSSQDISKITPRISTIDLSLNELTHLDFFKNLENNQTTFKLDDNPLPCNECQVHRTVLNRFKQIENYSNLTCCTTDTTSTVEGQQSRGKCRPRVFFQDISESEFGCDEAKFLEVWVQALIICTSIFAFLLLIFVIIWIRHGWAIRAYLYSKGLGCLFFNFINDLDDDEDGGDKVYDAFVSYSHMDEDWVLEELVNRLEEKEGFKLCLHFRDWIPGVFIPDQIVNSVDKSRRTVVVLSKHFVESVWSRLEFKAAHSQALNEKQNRLILILRGDDLADEDVQDEELKVYMKMNTYLKWSDPWFWHKLKYALPHKKPTDDESGTPKPKPNPIMQKFEKNFAKERAIRLDKIRAQIENST